ncbi:MAG: hypothetical protein ACKO03_00230 [Bacteroidota bacterium]
MLKRIFYIAFCTTLSGLLHAQEVRTTAIHLWNDQKVHVAGEDVWVDGIAGLAPFQTKTIVLRIINRNGTAVAETEIIPENNRIQGVITLPETLVSDYYFIDAYIKGMSSTTSLCPIMVIHPNLPPVECTPQLTKNASISTSPISIQLKKNSVAPRSAIEFNASGTDLLSQISIAAVLNDRLLELYDEDAKAQTLTIEHVQTGELNQEGRIFSVVALQNGGPAKGIKLVAAHKIPNSAIATALTDQEGKAQFILPLNFNDADLVIHPASKDQKNIRIVLANAELPATAVSYPCLKLNESMRTDLESRIFNSRVMKRYYGNALRAVELSEPDSSDFYGKPDVVFFLDDYVRFPVLEEVISEIIPQVRVKKNKDEVLIQALNQPLKAFFERQALLLVDGLPISNAQLLLDTDPLLIRSIEIVSRKYIQGTIEFNGIVHFKTYKSDLAGLKPDAALHYTLKTIQAKTTYLPADHSAKKNRMPDLRNILFLERDVVPSQLRDGLRFYASDAEGKYKIILRGIDAQNQSVTASSVIEVRRPD